MKKITITVPHGVSISNAEGATGLDRKQLMTLCLTASYSRPALKKAVRAFVSPPKSQQRQHQDLPQYT
jgi:hypothetical protein